MRYHLIRWNVGIRSLEMAAICLAPLHGATWADAGRGPRRWHGQSVLRLVDEEYGEGRVTREKLRFVVGHASQLSQQ